MFECNKFIRIFLILCSKQKLQFGRGDGNSGQGRQEQLWPFVPSHPKRFSCITKIEKNDKIIFSKTSTLRNENGLNLFGKRIRASKIQQQVGHVQDDQHGAQQRQP